METRHAERLLENPQVAATEYQRARALAAILGELSADGINILPVLTSEKRLHQMAAQIAFETYGICPQEFTEVAVA